MEKQQKKKVNELEKLDKVKIGYARVSTLYQNLGFSVQLDSLEDCDISFQQEIDELETRLSKQKEDVKNVEKFLEIVRKYTTLESLTPSIVNELIDRIEIHKPDKSTGKRIQQIDIYYRFVGKLDEI